MNHLLLTHKNFFKFGYDQVPFINRQNSDSKWFVEYGKSEKQALNFKNECIRTAQTIRENTKKDIWILFSGGVDSEVTLRSFVEAGIDVNVAILRFKNKLNAHDISYAIETCESLKINYKLFDFDILSFWKTNAVDYAHATQCFSPQLISTMYLMDQIDGFCVLGGGECLLTRDESGWGLLEKERIASWYRYFIQRNKEGSAGFFQYTPEIILSYLEDEFVKLSLENPKFNSTAEFKLEFYRKHFDVKPRPKYTGFENIQDEDYILRTELKKYYGDYDQVYKTSYSDLIKNLRPL